MADETKPVTIASLELENVKRVRAVALEPSPSGLTVIGGRNAQGKTSVIDSICWALGGAKYQPEAPRRDGAAGDPSLKVTMSNGIVAQRSGKSHALKVTDPSGAKAGQALLDAFVEQFALNVGRFLEQPDREKAKTLLRIVGVEGQLEEIDRQEAELSQQRLATGRLAKQRRGAAETMPRHEGVPDEPPDVGELAEQLREAMAANAAMASARMRADSLEEEARRAAMDVTRAEDALAKAKARFSECERAAGEAAQACVGMRAVDTSWIEDAMADAQRVGAEIADNEAWARADAEAGQLEAAYAELGEQIEAARARRLALLEGAKMPLEGLTVQDGCLAYKGHRWDGMSGAEQMMAATAIVRALNPRCGFVLLDKLEQMDVQTLAEFGAWCEREGLQVIGTRVSTGEECSVIIEDGMVASQAQEGPAKAAQGAAAYARPEVLPAPEAAAAPCAHAPLAAGRRF